MSPKILHADVLDGECDAAGAVGDGVALGAVLVSFMFDVVTQQLVVWTPPLHGQLRDVCVVLIVVRTGKSDLLTLLTEHFHNAAWRQRSVKERFTVTKPRQKKISLTMQLYGAF